MRIKIWTTMLLLTKTILTTTYAHRLNNEINYKRNDDYDDDLNNLTKFKTIRESDYLKKSTITNKENESNKQLYGDGNNILSGIIHSESHFKINKQGGNEERKSKEQIKRELDDAVEYGLKTMNELLHVKEPLWHKMGLYLDKDEPASHVANFGAPIKKAIELSNFGYASVEASKKIAEYYPENVSRQSSFRVETRLLHDECPLRGRPRCPLASKWYRTADGTCNNLDKPWRGSSLLPMERFLPPIYEDGLQEIRRSIFGNPLPSPRQISTTIHRDNNLELPTVNLMFMQWGQLIDHDLISTVKSRSFNGTVPRCCHRRGEALLPPELTHPSCLPIEVPPDDWFLSRFGIRCLEFIRSAPSTRIDCDLGWREQINQATSYLDGSTIYGSDIDTSDGMRIFQKGQLHYGRIQGQGPLQPPDPPGGEICRSGALTGDCLQSGDGRSTEQPGLTAIHTIWVRYHNKIANILSQLNQHWRDEKIYQETRKIVVALIQHITFREFLPIVLGQEVMDLFELNLERKGYYSGYDGRVNPAIANSFGTAAFRFGHSLVQNSYIRFDTQHRPIFNNVTLHEEFENVENIWSFGSLDRMLLGFCNQPSQRRDEFICDELTNHLFQSRGFPFGMDLAAINIQRGRDHGLPPFTSWRQPCSLSPINSWSDLEKIINPDTIRRLKNLYHHIDDIDLYTGALAERPVRGGIVGPTFACIIAQQFSNLRKGDRFWYENKGFESSFTPAQLQQIRHVTFAHILCQVLTEIETIQPFVFLMVDDFRNSRLSCDSPLLNNFDLTPWIEKDLEFRQAKKRKKLKRTTTTRPTNKPQIRQNITTKTGNSHKKQYISNSYGVDIIPDRPTYDSYDRPQPQKPDVTYLFGLVSETSPMPPPKPFEVNIKIQYYPPTQKPKKKRPKPNVYSDDFSVYKPIQLIRPSQNDYYTNKYEDVPITTTKRPYIYRPNNYNYVYTTRPTQTYYTYRRPQYDPYPDDMPRPMKIYSTGYVEKLSTNRDDDKFDFYSPKNQKTKYVKISSVTREQYVDPHRPTVELHIAQREGDLELDQDDDDIRMVDIEILPTENRWVVFNATEEVMDLVEIPDVNSNVSCSSELPRPITSMTDKRLNMTVT